MIEENRELHNELTRVRGKVRRLPDGSREQLLHAGLAGRLAELMTAEGDRKALLMRSTADHVALMSGAGSIAVEDSVLAAFPSALAAYRAQHQGED